MPDEHPDDAEYAFQAWLDQQRDVFSAGEAFKAGYRAGAERAEALETHLLTMVPRCYVCGDIWDSRCLPCMARVKSDSCTCRSWANAENRRDYWRARGVELLAARPADAGEGE